MSKQPLLNLWDPRACVPKQDVIEGKYYQADLALDLYTVVEGTAKPPYDTPESFFKATHPTITLKQVLCDVLLHLSGSKVINPVLLFDAGFGGGKTHTMAAIYYAAKYPSIGELRGIIGDTKVPESCRVVVIDGSAYGGRGVTRGGRRYRTIWADFLHQLGALELASESDNPEGIPDRGSIVRLLSQSPTLILLDEIPKYLDLLKDDPMLGKVKHFLHALSLAVCEAERCVLVVSVAGDAYGGAADSVRRELAEAMSILSRKMQSLEPVKGSDAPQILKKRLFDYVSQDAARKAAREYAQLYEDIKAPNRFRTADYEQRIFETYPFHPELIDALYERLSTMPEFQRTRGSLRLLANVVRKMWEDREEDAFLIHPHHVDLSSPEIVEELTTRLKEDKFSNAIKSDVYQQGGKKAKAKENDESYASHFRAPLFRRACNTIYLYSLTGAREEAKGIDTEDLLATLAVPTKLEQVQYYQDQVFPRISDSFWYVDVLGNRYVFKKEPTENRIIDQESQNVPIKDIVNTVREELQTLFATKGKGRFFVEIFPDDPGEIGDNTDLKIAILNPVNFSMSGESYVPPKISQFILNKDARGNLRAFRNNLYLLVSREGAWESLKETVSKLEVAKAISNDPGRYGIPHEKKKGLMQKVSQYESSVDESIRSSFTYLVYAKKGGGVEAKYFRPSGYGTAQSGQEVIWKILSEVLRRVTDEALDPDYLMAEVWPSGAQETTTRELFEAIHRKPGVVLPSSQSLFEKTIIKGVEQSTWVLVQQTNVFTPESTPNHVIVSSDARLLLPEEAFRRDLTDRSGHLCRKCLKWPCVCNITQKPPVGPQPPTPPPPAYEIFELQRPDLQIEDLQKWINREDIKEATEVIIKIKILNEAYVIPEFRNLLRLIGSERGVSVSLGVSAYVRKENLNAEISLSAEGEGLEKPMVKILEYLPSWEVTEFEGEVALKSKSINLEVIHTQLQNALKTADENVWLELKIKPKRDS